MIYCYVCCETHRDVRAAFIAGRSGHTCWCVELALIDGLESIQAYAEDAEVDLALDELDAQMGAP